jgi:hypothetical protein
MQDGLTMWCTNEKEALELAQIAKSLLQVAAQNASIERIC